MRINEILLEESTVPWDQIRAECTEILGWISPRMRFLYRGTKAHTESWYQSQTRPGRSPVDTDPRIQNFIDYKFSAVGLTALRHNSLFATPSYQAAKKYGNVYMIFPKDDFAWTGSTKIKDLYVDNPFSSSNPFGGGLAGHWSTDRLDDDLRRAYYAGDEQVPAEAQAEMSREWMRFKNNPQAMGRVSESNIILADIFENYQTSSPLLAELHRRYNWDDLISPKEFVTKLGYNQTNLGMMLRTDNEILIAGTYYAVHSQFMQEAEIKLFQ